LARTFVPSTAITPTWIAPALAQSANTSGSEASEIAMASGGGPEDIVTGPDGRLWFTQPAGSTGHIGVLATNATQSSDIQQFAVQPGSNPHDGDGVGCDT
jgi:streptogramin lyase